ncbi:MAG: glutamine-hydrolyzing carbamoyl-phosphate synthase small subunit [Bdellovibrionales bacterium]|nr:glutamine-hydrolyzing carbamoyl-phosphate synthase small subunit [Bdellovibrionales bacterium]
MKGIVVLPGSENSDDLILEGELFGALRPGIEQNVIFGELVFNTSMTGYQEILTDPSYAGQMVCFTASHIGNTGVNSEDLESGAIHAEGLILSNYVPKPSSYRAEETLEDFLKRKGRIGIHGVDTRRLTLALRDRGVTPGLMIPEAMRDRIPELKNELQAKKYGSFDWIKTVSTLKPYLHPAIQDAGKSRFKVVAFDFGIKGQLLRDLASRGCDLTVVPADFPAEEVEKMKPDGVFLSNGPGDPALATYAIKNVKALLGKMPIFGVCMGHQILSLAMGGKTYKLKFGHRGGNQPVKNLDSGAVEISSHNHGYAVDPESLPDTVQLTHVNLNDGCCEGIAVPTLRAFSVQYHPESSPGPHDSGYLFDRFIGMMERR